MPKLIILGAGGYGRTVADVANQIGYEIVFLDDSILDYSLSTFNCYITPDTFFIPAFGDNEFRLSWIEKLGSAGAKIATLIHPSAYISPTALVHTGSVILPKAIINTDVVVESGCIVNVGAIVDHGTILEEGVHIAPGAIVKGENRIKRCMKVESGEVVQARQYRI